MFYSARQIACTSSYAIDNGITNGIVNAAEYTVNGERFAGVNFRVFQGYRERNISVNVIQASFNDIV